MITRHPSSRVSPCLPRALLQGSSGQRNERGLSMKDRRRRSLQISKCRKPPHSMWWWQGEGRGGAMPFSSPRLLRPIRLPLLLYTVCAAQKVLYYPWKCNNCLQILPPNLLELCNYIFSSDTVIIFSFFKYWQKEHANCFCGSRKRVAIDPQSYTPPKKTPF